MDRLKFLKEFFIVKFVLFILFYIFSVFFLSLSLKNTIFLPIIYLVIYIILLSLYKNIKTQELIFSIFYIVSDILYFVILIQLTGGQKSIFVYFLPALLFSFLVYRNRLLFTLSYFSLLFFYFFIFNFEFKNKFLISISLILTISYIIYFLIAKLFYDYIFDDLYQKYEVKLKKSQEFASSQAKKIEKLNKILNEKLRQSYILMDISRELSSVLNRYLLLDLLLEKAKIGLNAKSVIFISIDNKNQKLQLASFEGLHRTEVIAFEKGIEYGKGLFGNVAISGKVINYYRGSLLDKYQVFKDFNIKFPFINSILIVPLKDFHKNEYIGMVCAINKLDEKMFLDEDEFFLKTLASQAVISLLNIEFTESIKGSLEDTMKVLGAAIESKDKYTHVLHTERVSNIAVDIAKDLGLDEKEIENIKYGALIHDIGKIAIPDHILMKRGPLSKEEFEIIKRHPVEGAKILSRSRYLKKYIPYVRDHHERWDGSGYPRGLKGDEISIGAQIVAVADVYDSIATPRPYNKDRASPKNAIEIIKKGSGTQFNPIIVESFLRVMAKRFKKYNR